jgi:hypothetical protein
MELAQLAIKRYRVDAFPGFPDRIEMQDVAIGESVLLLNHVSQPANSPFRATHAIFIREGAETPYLGIDEVPEVMRRRVLSLRSFDEEGMMLDADLVEGHQTEVLIAQLFKNSRAAYLHAHYAKRGCYSARIDRN